MMNCVDVSTEAKFLKKKTKEPKSEKVYNKVEVEKVHEENVKCIAGWTMPGTVLTLLLSKFLEL